MSENGRPQMSDAASHGLGNPNKSAWVSPPRGVGMCLGCGAVEVNLDELAGTRDLGDLGRDYPIGYGCEVCS